MRPRLPSWCDGLRIADPARDPSVDVSPAVPDMSPNPDIRRAVTRASPVGQRGYRYAEELGHVVRLQQHHNTRPLMAADLACDHTNLGDLTPDLTSSVHPSRTHSSDTPLQFAGSPTGTCRASRLPPVVVVTVDVRDTTRGLGRAGRLRPGRGGVITIGDERAVVASHRGYWIVLFEDVHADFLVGWPAVEVVD